MKRIAAIVLIATAAVAIALTSGSANSGLGKGERVVPFHPDHVVGPLKGTNNCFPCTFQNRPQVQVWVNGESHENMLKIAKSLDSAMNSYSKQEFKAMIVVVAPKDDHKDLTAKIKQVVADNKLNNIDISLIDPKNESVGHYKINTDATVKNTVFVYRNWKVEEKMVNLKADEEGLKSLNDAIGTITK